MTIYNNTSEVYYDVVLSAALCNPQIDDVVECRVEKMNKMGILATGTNNIPIRVIIARQHHEEGTFPENINIGDIIHPVVIGNRFKNKDKIISVLAKFTATQ